MWTWAGLLASGGLGVETQAIQLDPFGPAGAGGTVNGQTLLVGEGGTVFEVDAFLQVDGLDLNGASDGTAARLSADSLPPELAVSFSAELSGDGTDLTLRYRIDNVGVAAITSVSVLSLFDAEIDELANTYFNEFAETAGSPAVGQGFEVDEPGFGSGDLLQHLIAGQLDGTNAIVQGAEDDVAMALSFALGTLPAGTFALVELLVSEDGDSLGPFSILQRDPASTTEITYSGMASAVPEPSTLALVLLGLGGLAAGARRLPTGPAGIRSRPRGQRRPLS